MKIPISIISYPATYPIKPWDHLRNDALRNAHHPNAPRSRPGPGVGWIPGWKGGRTQSSRKLEFTQLS